MIPGVTYEEICDAFAAAFSRDDMHEMLRKKLTIELDDLTGPNSTRGKVVSDTIDWSERRGRTAELIRAGYEFNPTHQAMEEIYQKYGMTAVNLQEQGKPAEVLKVSQGGFEKTIKQRLPAFDFAVWREKMALIEGRVCRVEIDAKPTGTGFLVGPDAVLTNYHVLEELIKGALQPGQVACRFDYKVLPDKSRVEGTVVNLHPAEWKLDFSLFAPAEKTTTPDTPPPTMDELDYALVRLERRVGDESLPSSTGIQGAKRGWITVPALPFAFVSKTPLMIAQHPDGMPLKLAVDTDSVIGVNASGTRVRYATNTEAGSSGSPVFDLNWNLVALHHLGDPACDLPPTYNQGVPIDRVRGRVTNPNREGAAARMAALGKPGD